VQANSHTGDLFPETLQESERPVTDFYQTWFYLFHVGDDRLQAELSLPSRIDSEGFIVGWYERILLPSLIIDPSQIANDPDGFTPEVDIDVVRKQG
jgi:hypothetical protein